VSKSGELPYILSVPHIHLDNVLAAARLASSGNGAPEILVEHHVIEIMRQAIPAFVNMLAKHSSLAMKMMALSKADLEDISLFIIYYSAYLTSLQKDYIKKLGVNMPPLTGSMKGLLGQTGSSERPPSWEPVLYQQRLEASPLQHLERWAALMPMMGIKATYVMVDGVDELMESAESPNYAHYLIRPLLTHLRLMDGIPHLAFKYFLPSDLEKLVLSDPAFRHDRGFIVQKIEWQPNDLVNILRERLNALRRQDYEIRDRTAAGFDALCVPELRDQIEQTIAILAKGNPRRLMNFCALMVTTHCNRDLPPLQEDLYQLNREDFETAKKIFLAGSMPLQNTAVGQQVDILSLIRQGEGEFLEFKSSMRYDYQKKDINKEDLGFAIAKTIAGFLNGSGGILVIGIADDGQILGIENDIQTLTKKSLDGFQFAFKDLIRAFLGMEHLAYLHMFFDRVETHMVCAVQAEKSPSPVYLKNGNENEFYVRMLNSTIKLSLPETVNYIRSRWG